MHFKDAKGNLIRTVEANEGDDLLGIAHEYDIDLEGAHPSPPLLLHPALTPTRRMRGLCRVLDMSRHPRPRELRQGPRARGSSPSPSPIPLSPLVVTSNGIGTQDDENDMLDMAFGLTDTSRLGCQVRLTKELDGLTATLPAATRNMFVDGAPP